MIIAIDFDDTYTVDPELWNDFIRKAQENGHRIICVTARYDDGRHGANRDVKDTIGKVLSTEDIFYSGITAKQEYMINQHHIYVNIWIDDIPLGIVE